METKKYIFTINHAGEHEVVKFSIEAESEEAAIRYATQLNPSATLLKQDNSQWITEGPIVYKSPYIW